MIELNNENNNERDDYLFGSKSTLEEFEQKAFLDAHHLVRRKSCCCQSCGKESMKIIKMDKLAMDCLMVDISPKLRTKFKK